MTLLTAFSTDIGDASSSGMHSRQNSKREVRAVQTDYFFKEFCCKRKEKKINRGRSGIKRGFVWFLEMR